MKRERIGLSVNYTIYMGTAVKLSDVYRNFHWRGGDIYSLFLR